MSGDIEQNDDTIPSWRLLNILPCTSELEKSDPKKASSLYEKALAFNAGSYKVWHAYLLHLSRQLEGKSLDDPLHNEVNETFERSLVFMHRMPRIWIEFCTLLVRQLFVTRTRHTFDKALEALPITQHSRIWPLYLDFIKKKHVPVETAVRVFKRYMQFRPEDAESFIDYLYSKDRIDEASRLLCDIINDPNFQSVKNKNKYQLWEELCDMLCEHADQIQSVDVEAVLRDGISRYHDQQGRLWNALARYYIRLGMFAGARSTFEEAIQTVTTKKDFVEVWEAYTNFEELYIERLIEKGDLDQSELLDLEIRQATLEDLVTNNGLLLNRVALRQNPHNVHEWKKRVQLYDQFDNSKQAKAETYTEALKTVDPKQALGNYETLWIDYALLYAESGEVNKAREVFEKAIQASFVKPDDLAKVWCAYIEYELRIRSNKALKLAKRATANSKNLQLWMILADLEENFGTFNSTKAVYEKILDIRIATPQLILNYAAFLEDRQYYEDSFRVFERGISLFRWPNLYSIWHTYLNKFLSRYGTKKLDRLRDLFEKCLKDCSRSYALEFYLLYAKIEEQEGLVSRAQSIYTRAADAVEPTKKADLYKIYIRSMMKLVSITKIRSIYEEAIASLDNKAARNFCLEYANLEEGLDEVDRCRTIYSHCSQMCDPRVDKEFWKLWADFERNHGSLETVEEMLRIKRSVIALNPRPEYLADVTIESSTIAKAIEDKVLGTDN